MFDPLLPNSITNIGTPLVIIFSADSQPAVHEAALVLEAMNIEHLVESTAEGWVLQVAEEDQRDAHFQLQAYWTENQPSTIKPEPALMVDSGWVGVLGYLAVIWAIPVLQGFTGTDLTQAGRLHAELVRDGELWRVVTALTLHADMAHIMGNSFFGAVFGLFVGRYLGSGLGWLLVLICGAAANLLNGLIQADSFKAIGASTATFAALGIVPAFGWRRGFFRGRGFRRGFAPIFAAIAILSFTGFGGPNIDVGGHLFGFLMGIGMGLAVANIDLHSRSKGDQQRAGIAALALVVLAWGLAL